MANPLRNIETLTADEIDQWCSNNFIEKTLITRVKHIRELTGCGLKTAKYKHDELFVS